MSAHQPSLAFKADPDFDAARLAADDGEALVLDLDGFEGPLHLLLELARRLAQERMIGLRRAGVERHAARAVVRPEDGGETAHAATPKKGLASGMKPNPNGTAMPSRIHRGLPHSTINSPSAPAE